jgi:hypothetical protein
MVVVLVFFMALNPGDHETKRLALDAWWLHKPPPYTVPGGSQAAARLIVRCRPEMRDEYGGCLKIGYPY